MAKTKKQKPRKEQAALNEKVVEFLCKHPCVDCGNRDPIVLEFDHVRGEKDRSVSDMIRSIGYDWEMISNEIKKCEVRCANCHRKMTAKRDGRWLRAKAAAAMGL